MSIRDTLRGLFHRAKEQATDMAQVARMKLEIRDMEGKRDHLFREIGRAVYARQKEGRGFPDFDRACADVRAVEESIEKKRAELNGLRGRSAGAESATDPASTPTGV